jgi:hypothetical protein
MTKKVQPPKKNKTPAKKQIGPTSSPVSLTKNEMRIKYSNSYDLLDKLQSLSQSVSRLHTHQLIAQQSGAAVAGNALDHLSSDDVDVLGPERAIAIVTKCANETDLSKKLSDIPGLDPIIFQSCVKTGVIAAGYKPDGVPASPSTTLWDVVQAIQGCSK